ncbi:MAG: hypothetical protein HUU20_00280 [Pirellulales bacterium]|nr:hypothetical protein [Pirellulales bacterium]
MSRKDQRGVIFDMLADADLVVDGLKELSPERLRRLIDGRREGRWSDGALE